MLVLQHQTPIEKNYADSPSAAPAWCNWSQWWCTKTMHCSGEPLPLLMLMLVLGMLVVHISADLVVGATYMAICSSLSTLSTNYADSPSAAPMWSQWWWCTKTMHYSGEPLPLLMLMLMVGYTHIPCFSPNLLNRAGI